MTDQIQINLRAMFDLEPASPVSTEYPRSDGGPYYPRSDHFYFECLECGYLLSSKTRTSGGCSCGNVFLDVEAGKPSIKDHDKMRFVRLKRKGSRQRRLAWTFTILVLLAVIGLLLLQWLRGGVHVTIQNKETTPIRSVVLHITGASYLLGDIAPGSSAEATVNPHGESHLEIEFTNVYGNTERLNAGGYFESGYRGTIRISVKNGAIEKNEQHTELPP